MTTIPVAAKEADNRVCITTCITQKTFSLLRPHLPRHWATYLCSTTPYSTRLFLENCSTGKLFTEKEKLFQVSAAAASALLSDISSLDLQSYIDSSGADQNGLAHEQADDGQTDEGPYSDCLSQYLAGSSDDGGRQHNHHDASNPDTANVYHETNFQTHHGVHPSDGYVSYQHETTNGGGGFAFDPSTPLSSLCSPPHYVQQPQHQYHQNHLPVQPDYQHNGTADATSTVTSNGFHQQTMMIPATVPSPYTPSPSPVSPIVPSHLQQQQQQQRFQHQNGFYSGVTHPTYPTAMHTQQQQQPQQTSTSFMIDCANSVLYNMADSAGSGWDHAAELTSVTTEALPHLMEQHQHEPIMDDPIIGKPVKVKKPRPSRAKKSISLLEEPPPEVKKRRKPASSGNKGANELDEMLMAARSSAAGRFTSSMRPSTALLLDPKRPGTGLYWNLVKNETVTPPVLTAPSLSSRQLAKSRVRIGKDHQCTALPRCKKKEGNKDKEPAILCWSGSSSAGGEQQVARLLAWSRSSALPGPRRTEEEVLAVLTHFRNDLQVCLNVKRIIFYFLIKTNVFDRRPRCICSPNLRSIRIGVARLGPKKRWPSFTPLYYSTARISPKLLNT